MYVKDRGPRVVAADEKLLIKYMSELTGSSSQHQKGTIPLDVPVSHISVYVY